MRYSYNSAPGADAYEALSMDDDYTVVEPPDHIDFGITNFCNLSCSFCDVGAKESGAQQTTAQIGIRKFWSLTYDTNGHE